MLINKKVVPKRIKQARISRGFSKVELADLIGVTRQAVSQYESGKIEPSWGVLNEMSRILKYPVDFFRKSVSEEAQASVVFFRSKKTAKKKDMESAIEKIKVFSDIHSFLATYIDFPKPDLPIIDYLGDGINPLDNETIEQYAQELRRHWKLANSPIQNLTNVVQKKGVVISKMDLRLGKIDAFSVVLDNIPYIFLGNTQSSNARIRFDIAHELGHILMHTDSFDESDFENPATKKVLENEADRFAGAFLLPRVKFEEDIFSTSINHFITLKKKWLTSISSMIYRCEELGLFSSNQIKYLKDQMTMKRYWRKEPLDDAIPKEVPLMEKQAIELILNHNVLTPSEIVNQIACRAEEIEQYCFLEEGTLKEERTDNIVKFRI